VSEIELNDSILTRTDPRANAYMYYLLDVFHKVSGKFDIRYWAECGTVLGYKRHGGIIPWDDDIDVDIHPDDLSKLCSVEVEEEFFNYGCSLDPIYFGYRVCPISLPTFGTSVKNNTTKGVEYHWPFLDVFATAFFDKTGSGVRDHIRYKDQDALKWWPDYYLTQEELQIELVDFGPSDMRIKIFVPGKIEDYLLRIYGDDYMSVAYQELDHANNRPIEKVICKLIDREPGQVICDEVLIRGLCEPIRVSASSVDTNECDDSRILKHTQALIQIAVGGDATTMQLNGATESRRGVADRQAIERGENEGMIIGQA